MTICDSEGEAVSPVTISPSSASIVAAASEQSWYALLTRSRHEKVVANRLSESGIPVFLPLVTETRRWSDRKKTVQLPLFSCYVFAKLLENRDIRLRALRVGGVLNLVGARGEGTPIPEEQIEAVRRVIQERLEWRAHPFIRIGQRVRIRGGALDGIEGVLSSRGGDSALIISIDAIQRSMEVQISGYDVEPR